MTPLEQLRESAREKRDAAIQDARDEYRQSIRDLNAMARKLGQRLPRKPRRKTRPKPPAHGGDFSKMTVRQAAETVLHDSGPLPLAELTLEVMRRGCRAKDAPRAVAHAVRSALLYHKGRFSRDGEGRWVAC